MISKKLMQAMVLSALGIVFYMNGQPKRTRTFEYKPEVDVEYETGRYSSEFPTQATPAKSGSVSLTQPLNENSEMKKIIAAINDSEESVPNIIKRVKTYFEHCQSEECTESGHRPPLDKCIDTAAAAGRTNLAEQLKSMQK